MLGLPRAAAARSRSSWCSPCRRRRSSWRGSRRATSSTESLGLERRAGDRRSRRARATASNRSIGEQYRDWIAGAARFDFGRSLLYDRPVGRSHSRARGQHRDPRGHGARSSPRSSACRSASSPAAARGGLADRRRSGRRRSCCCRCRRCSRRSFLVFAAARTGWLPVGGMTSRRCAGGGDLLRHLVVPAAALALPLAAMFERLQSQAMSEVIGQPYVLATLARGVPRSRVDLARRAEGRAAARSRRSTASSSARCSADRSPSKRSRPGRASAS